jgi:hypothetical protein
MTLFAEIKSTITSQIADSLPILFPPPSTLRTFTLYIGRPPRLLEQRIECDLAGLINPYWLEREVMMKKILFCLFVVYIIPSAVLAASFPQSIAFEFQEHGKFTGIIGKAYVTDTAIEIVTFAENSGEIVPFAFIETVLEKQTQIDGLYSLKCRNQLGVVSAGTMDVRDPLKPKITLVNDNGITLTNISDGGREMKTKFLPKIRLGK